MVLLFGDWPETLQPLQIALVADPVCKFSTKESKHAVWQRSMPTSEMQKHGEEES
jgi:hypothetical protein